MLEEADQDLWLPLPTTQIPVQLPAKLTRRPRTPPASSVGLHVVVQQLHRIQLRTIARQKVELDPLGMPPNPGADQLGVVHRMAIHDQVDLPSTAIAQQPAEEVDEHRPLKDPVNSRNRNLPALEIALSMLTPNRLPVRLITGVCPIGAHDRPAAASERTPISSSHNTTPPSRLACARMAGNSVASQRATAVGFAPGRGAAASAD
jgi:hypothetical protein